MLIRFNDEFRHVYVSNSELVMSLVTPKAVMDGARGSTTEVEVEEQQEQQSEERNASRDHSVLKSLANEEIHVSKEHSDAMPPTNEEKHVSRDHSDVMPLTNDGRHESRGRDLAFTSEDLIVNWSLFRVCFVSITEDLSGSSPASTNWGELVLGEEQAFDSPDAFCGAVFKYSTANQFTYKFLDNLKCYMRV